MMHLYSAGRPEPLAARLAKVMADERLDPMTPEWLAVPSDGMRRWLTLELARHLGNSGPDRADGIAANIERAYPGTLRSLVLNAGRSDAKGDPWSIERLVWSVLAVAEQRRGDPELSAFLALPDGASRFAKARRVADLFDRYHLHRPGMIRAWAAGRIVDGTRGAIADHETWQPYLWTLVRAEVGEPSPPERFAELVERVRSGDLVLDLPDRLILFGFTLLPGGGFLELAQAVAEHRDVHLFLLEPCLLDTVALGPAISHFPPGARRLRADDRTAELIRQPLLRSWGRLHRETAVLLADARADGLPAAVREPEPDGLPSDGTLLGRLQHSIRTNAQPARLPLDERDRSVQFHACFGPTRQVEVVRDAILHLLAEPGSELTEDDILVLCLALDRFAPLIEAVFGRSADPVSQRGDHPGATGDVDGAPPLRYRIADQSIRTANPVLGATTSLLELVHGRFEFAAVLDFLSLAPVRERFGFADEDLATITEWVSATNVRWGLDAGYRERFGVSGSIASNTWRAALDRLMVGTAVFDGDLTLSVGNVVPYGVEGNDVETLGRLAEVLWHLADLATETTDSRPIAAWVDRLRDACAALFGTSGDTAWQLEGLQRILGEVVDEASTEGVASVVPLDFIDVRRLFDERLDAEVGRPDFFRGGITVTSLTPLRWVPFRVVCLLGMDQSAFGSTTVAGDDLAALNSELGDPDPRSEVRESLLEAVLAAEDHLVVVRDGHDVRTNQPIARAVVTAEFFDAVADLVEPGDDEELERRLEIPHPRHAFDQRCFVEGNLVDGLVWGFDQGALNGARERRGRTSATVPFLGAPLEGTEVTTIELSDLHAFFKDPVEAFLTGRLQAKLPRPEELQSATIPLDLDGLEKWGIGDRLLRSRMEGTEFEDWAVVERELGTLPPGELGSQLLAEVRVAVDQLVDEADRLGVLRQPVDHRPVDLELESGIRISGSIPLRLAPASRGPARITYSRSKAFQWVAAWLDLMALTASDPDLPWRSVSVALGEKGQPPVVKNLVPSPGPTGAAACARAALSVAVDCFRRGMREPLPLFPNYSREVFRGRHTRVTWSSPFDRSDGDMPATALAFDGADFDEIMSLPVRPDDPVVPVDPDDPRGRRDRVSVYAAYLWGAVDDSCRNTEDPEGLGVSGAERATG